MRYLVFIVASGSVSVRNGDCVFWEYLHSHAYFQVSYGAGFIEFSAEEAKRVYGDIIPSPLPDRRLFVLKQVCVIFTIFLSVSPKFGNIENLNSFWEVSNNPLEPDKAK